MPGQQDPGVRAQDHREVAAEHGGLGLQPRHRRLHQLPDGQGRQEQEAGGVSHRRVRRHQPGHQCC